MANYLALVITFSVAGIAAATTGSLLYVAMDDVAAQTIGVFRLDLATMTESHVGTIGQYGNWATEAVALRSTTYITNLAATTPIDPWVPATCSPPCKSGALCCRDPQPGGSVLCLKVDKCSDMHGGTTQHGETVGVDLTSGKVSFARDICGVLLSTQGF